MNPVIQSFSLAGYHFPLPFNIWKSTSLKLRSYCKKEKLASGEGFLSSERESFLSSSPQKETLYCIANVKFSFSSLRFLFLSSGILRYTEGVKDQRNRVDQDFGKIWFTSITRRPTEVRLSFCSSNLYLSTSTYYPWLFMHAKPV